MVVLDEARRGIQIFSTRPNDPDDAAAVLERDGEELIQLDEDHAQNAQRRVDDEVVDVVGGGEEATAEKTTG